MAGITTALAVTFKQDLMSAVHNFNATVTPTGTTSNTTFTVTSLSALTGLAVGMGLSGTGIPASTVLASIDSSTQLTMSKAATASNSGITVTATGDSWKVALFKTSVTGTYDATTTNYTDMTGNSDETSGTGYSAGGTALTNVSPTFTSTTAFVSFSPNPTWTSATFSSDGCMIYNTSRRGPTATRAASVHVFTNKPVSVTSGTFTLNIPSADSSNAIIRLG